MKADSSISEKKNIKLSREDEAKRDLLHTGISRKNTFFLITIVFYILLTLPLFDLFFQLSQSNTGYVKTLIRETGSIFLLPGDIKYILKNKSENNNTSEDDQNADMNARIKTVIKEKVQHIKNVESQLEENSIIRTKIIKLMQSVFVKLAKGNEKVFIGRNSWMFYKPGTETITSGKLMKKTGCPPVNAIIEFRDQLSEQNIDLVVMPMPSKATVYPEPLSRSPGKITAPVQNEEYTEFIDILISNNIKVFDPSEILYTGKSEKDTYLKTDSHWSYFGMEKSAEFLARYLNENISFNLGAFPADSIHTGHKTVSNTGDLFQMLNLPGKMKEKYRETIEIRNINYQHKPDYEESEILLLGDSFSNIFSMSKMGWGSSSGLADQLSYFMNRPVDRIIQNDNGSYATRERLSSLLKQGENKLKNKKVVIYEFAARELFLGNWKTGFDYEQKESFPEYTFSGSSDVIIRIDSVSEIPNPKFSDYPDCLYSVLATVVGYNSGSSVPGEIKMYAWAFEDFELKATANLKPGDYIRASIIPMKSAPPDILTLQSADDFPKNDSYQYWTDNFSITEYDPAGNTPTQNILTNEQLENQATEAVQTNIPEKTEWKIAKTQDTLFKFINEKRIPQPYFPAEKCIISQKDSFVYQISEFPVSPGSSVTGNIYLWSEKPAKVRLRIVRHGKTDIESGPFIEKEITAIPELYSISYTFRNDHDNCRLEVWPTHENQTVFLSKAVFETGSSSAKTFSNLKYSLGEDLSSSFIQQEMKKIQDEVIKYKSWKNWLNSLKPFYKALAEKKAILKQKYPDYDSFQGDNDFLYSRGRTSYLEYSDWLNSWNKDKFEVYPEAFDSISSLNDDLKKLGIKLIVVPIPTRAEVYYENIGLDSVPSLPVAPQRKKFILQLLESGIEAIDLLPFFDSEKSAGLLYAKDDPHWIYEGSLFAAEIISRHINIKPDTPVKYKLGYEEMSVESVRTLYKWLPDEIKKNYPKVYYNNYSVTDDNGRVYSNDPDSPVLLVGDSYSAESRKFSEYLAYQIGMPVDLLWKSGGGPILAKALAEMDRNKLGKKKIIIFAFIARYLPSTKWETAEF